MKVSLINQSNNESIAIPNQQVTVLGRGVFGVRIKGKFHNNSKVF
jgi:hypothetical protein